MIDRSQAPRIFSPQEFDYILPDISTRTLGNGITLYSLQGAPEPVLQLELVFEAGQWHESRNGVSQASAALFKSGTSTRTSFQINDALEQYGASVKAHNSSDWATVSISCLSRHLEKILPLVYELLTDTVFPQHEVDIYTRNAKEKLSVQLLKSDFVANRKIDEYLYGYHHPYGTYMNPGDYDVLNRELLLEHLSQKYVPANCRMFLAGQFDESHIQAIDNTLGKQWNPVARPSKPDYPIVAEKQLKHRILHDAQSVQGAVRVARHCPHKDHPDYVPLVLMNTLFGGYFGSRLMSNIREEKGYTYGIHSFLLNHKEHTSYMISTEAGRDVCEKVLEEIYKEMEILKTEAVEDDELDLVKNYLLGSILGGLDGSFQVIQRWKNLILNGFGRERFESNIRIYKTMDATAIQDLATRYLNPGEYYELVVT